jgi:hydrogenase 3 maturation protease
LFGKGVCPLFLLVIMDKTILHEMLTGRVVIACIGNELRGDDGVGPFMAGLIRPTSRVRVINCGETPENFLGVIASYEPERVVIIDAAEFGGDPGEIRVVRKDEIAGGGLSTHDAILTLFADFIEEQTGARTFFLAVQPVRSDVGDTLSPAVEQAGREVAASINDVISGG